MNQLSNIGNRPNQIGRYSSTSNDENNHSINSSAGLSLQSFVDDIPYEFNQKYRTIVVHNIDIPEYDTTKIQDILAKSIDFTLENKVLLEALEDVQRKKKEIEADTLRQQQTLTMPSTTITANCPPIAINPTLNQSSVITENIPFPVNHQLPPSVTLLPATPLPPPVPPVKSVSPSYRLPSVRDIYWPTGNQQQYNLPVSTGPLTFASNTLSLPTPISSTNSSPNSIKQTNQSCNTCDSAMTNDLTAAFDGALGSDDPFHDAELKSLNDIAELKHLYSAFGSANTVRR